MSPEEIRQIAQFLSGFGFSVVSWDTRNGKLRLVIEVNDDDRQGD
jgi:hypothetical protein